MSRKTRKLMWSVPLIAAVAVIGALAAFVMLAPGGAQAHQPVRDAMGMLKSTPHLPPDPVTGIDVFTPTVDNGGRTSLQVSWNAPTTGDMPTMYRVDVSTDTDVWNNVIGGEEAGKGTLTESMAMENCTSDDEGNRCYTATGLKPDMQYHFRVFAMNDFGTSGISVDETIASGTTLPIDPPAKATGLAATDYYTDKIVVTWDKVEMTGGADVLWYCLGVASSPSGTFDDLTDSANVADCLSATKSVGVTDAGIVELLTLNIDTTPATYESQTAVIPAMKPVLDADGDPVKDADGNVVMEDNLSYTHGNIGGGDHDGDADDATGVSANLPHVIELRYRLYAVTDVDGKASTTGDRRIARAASEVAIGSTVRPADKPSPEAARPGSIGNLRAVAYVTDIDPDDDAATPPALPPLWEDGDNDAATPLTRVSGFATLQGLHFFWTHPANYEDDPDDTVSTPHPWRIEVQRRVPRSEDHADYTDWQFVDGTGQISTPTDPTTENSPLAAHVALADNYGVPQFTVNFAEATTALDATPNPTFAAPTLWGDNASSRTYRVRYVNPGADADSTDDDVNGPWATIEIPQVTIDYFRNATVPDTTSRLPIILRSTDNAGDGLKFEHNTSNPRDRINLLWDRNANARTGQNQPNGYVIDRSADGGDTWHTLERADSPLDLGTAETFTDSPRGEHKVVPGAKYTYRVFPVFIVSGPDAYGVPALINASSRGADLPSGVRNLRVEADGQHAMKLSWDAPADNGGQPVLGYLIQVASDSDGDPGEFETINPDDVADPLTTKVTKEDDATTYRYNPTTGTAPNLTPVLSPGAMRWFRVIPITVENDGDRETGGSIVGLDGVDDTGEDRSPRDSADRAIANHPLADDKERATPKKGQTADLDDAAKDKDKVAAPVDLTAEAASDTNSLADSDRGVFLTWNQVKAPDVQTSFYRIERVRMNTGVDALDNDEDAWQHMARISDVTSWTDPTPLRQDEEVRYYRVGSEGIGSGATTEWVAMRVKYALHMAHMPDAPMNVMAESNAEGTMLTVTWDAPGSDGGSDITGYKVMYRMSDSTGDYMSMSIDAADDGTIATMATISGLSPNSSYDIAVVAVNAHGDSYKGMAMGVMTSDIVPNMPTASAMADSRTQITVSWMAPEPNRGSAITKYIVEQSYMGMFLDDGIAHPDHVFDNHMEWWETLNCEGMLLAVGSDADHTDMSNADVMMYCGHFLNTEPTNITDASKELSDEAKADVEMYFNKRYKITDAMTMSASFMGLNPGAEYMYRVKAVNAAGTSAWSATATATTTANMMPTASDIADVTVTEGAEDDTMDLSMYFSDGDDATLMYKAESTNAAVADVSVAEGSSTLTIMYGDVGTATITVTATDMFDAYAMQTFMVEVEAAEPAELMPVSGVMATHDGLEVTVTWGGGDNADRFQVALIRNVDGVWDIPNAVYDPAPGSPFMVNMSDRPAGTYHVFVAAARGTEWTNWVSAATPLAYQPQ